MTTTIECSAEQSTKEAPHGAMKTVVFVNNKPFQWVEGVGLDPAAVEEVIYFIRGMVRGYFVRLRSHSLTFDDLLQEGVLGALEAAKRFDPSKGFKFLTYAEWWIRKQLQDTLRDDVVSLSVRAVQSGVPAFIRLDGPMEFADSNMAPRSDSQELSGGNNTEHVVEAASTLQVLHEVMSTLSPIEMDVVRRRFGLGGGEPEILETIAASYSVSRERIRQREIAALAALRRALQKRGLLEQHLPAELQSIEAIGV